MVKFPALGRSTSWSKVRETCVHDQGVLHTRLRLSEDQERKRWCWLGFHRVPALETCTEQSGCAIYQILNTALEVAQAESGKGELFDSLVVCRNQALSAVFKNGSQDRMGQRVCPTVFPPIWELCVH